VDPSIDIRNREQTERLRAMQGWSDEALARRVGEHWTVGVVLAHIAYWDSRTLAVLELAVRHGLPRAWWTPAEAGAVNDARLQIWLAIPPREALRQAIQTAEILDLVISELPAPIVEAVTVERARSFDRYRHRGDHLDEVDRAVAEED
jgi:hypothetical protein